MQRPNLSEISKQSGKSVSTVSKVLRNCPGVSEETRETVMRAADTVSRTPYGGFSAGGEISVILPDIPSYFWKRAQDALRENPGNVKLSIYSRAGTTEGCEIAYRYLSAAAERGARAIIIAARPDEKLTALMRDLAQSRLVLQLCEYTPIPNTFFVGSDGYADGARLARELICKEGGGTAVGVMAKTGSMLAETRVKGFLDALPDGVTVYRIEAPESSELYSAHLARAIAALNVPLDYLFSYDGVILPACEALYKLRSRMNARLLGFEYPKSAEKFMESGRIAALAVQDPSKQLRLALSLAERYVACGCFPDRKFTYRASEMITHGIP